MQKKLFEHIASVLFVLFIFAVMIVIIDYIRESEREETEAVVAPYRDIPFINWGNPYHRALFKETLNIYYPDEKERNYSLVNSIIADWTKQFTDPSRKTGAEKRGLTTSTIIQIFPMYIKFIFVFLIVIATTYYGAQTLGVYRFVKTKQHRSSNIRYLVELIINSRGKIYNIGFFLTIFKLIAQAIFKGIAVFILFAPAYVIAYSIKSDFSSNSILIMIILGVISNGLLITYSNKFFTFLIAESRKGYVDSAIVKNLNSSFEWDTHDGITVKSLFSLRKRFTSHIFDHIFMNAQLQYIPTTKELASFLISGLVIIEMALNIQGHYSYTMLKFILTKEYDVIIFMLFGIFLIVKITEAVVDYAYFKIKRRYEN